MYSTLKRLFFIVALLSGVASLFITLGTLNKRLPGGLTTANHPWLIAVSVFAVSLVVCIALKILSPAFEKHEALH